MELPGGSDGKESACNAGDQLQSLGWEDLLEEGMAIHSSIFACLAKLIQCLRFKNKIKLKKKNIVIKMSNKSDILWLKKKRIHGQRRLAGYSLWGRKESDTTE